MTRTLIWPFALALVFDSTLLTGQTRDSRFKVDLAIPESPALSLVSGDKSKLLRPSTVREFSAAFEGFVSDSGRFRLPAAFGLEVAPRLLFGTRSLSPERYRSAEWLSRLQLSLAAHRASNEDVTTAVAWGLRTTPINHADPRARENRSYQLGIDSLLSQLATIHESELAAARNALECTSTDCLTAGNSSSRESPRTAGDITHQLLCRSDSVPGRMECSVRALRITPEPVAAPVARMDAVISEIKRRKKQFEDEKWNATVLDIAVGSRAQARDSTGIGPVVQEYAAWASFGFGPSSGTQLLLLARGSFSRDSVNTKRSFATDGFLGTRLYLGANGYKAFGEAQVRSGEQGDWFFNSGVELRVVQSFWAVISAGYTPAYANGPGRWVTSLRMSVAPPSRPDS